MRSTLIVVSLAATLAGCATSTASTPTQLSPTSARPAATTHTTRRHRRSRHAPRPTPRSRPRPVRRSPSGLAVSSASGHRVQPQPAPGSCHVTGHGEMVMPDRRCTPGAVSPAVSQANIHRTICVPGYTETIRPSESITEPEKLASMAAYGYAGRSPRDFEYDHLVSLELGGAVNDARNLWPESGASPNRKDTVENALHRMVCDGEMSLVRAQHIIARDWLGWARSHQQGSPTTAAPGPAPTRSGGSAGPVGTADVNCSDFSTHAAAQRWFTAHGGSASNDVAGLDGDHDGQACESLP